LLVYTLVVLAVSLSANASTVTYTVNFGDSYEGTFDISKDLFIPTFDPSLGTLESVKLDYSVDADGWLGFENTTAIPPASVTLKTYSGTLSNPTDWTYGNLGLKFGSQTLASVSWTDAQNYVFTGLTAYDGTTDWAGTSGKQTVYLDKHDGGSTTYTTGLDMFIGASPLKLTYDLDGTAEIVLGFSGGNGSAKINTTGAGQVSIAYTYVPEPATMALLGLGGLLLRKKK
jgi:hypothetical protein